MERERVTISIKKDILKRIDEKIDGLKTRNRSHAIELLVSDSLGISQIDCAIIMAGGKGAIRLVPVIEYSIESLSSFGVANIFVAVGYLGDKIKQELEKKKFLANIEFIEGGEGTAGALNLLKGRIKKPFFVVNSDEVFTADFKKIADFHNLHTPLATIATKNQALMKGYYILDPGIFSYISGGFSMLEEDVFPKLLAENNLLIFPTLT